MAKKAAAELPSNIKEFNEIAAVVLAECYKSHPKGALVDVSTIARILGVPPLDVMPSGRTFQDVYVHTISWLAREDFVKDIGLEPRRCVLTARSLGGIGTIGPVLSAASNQASSETGKRKIAELMGNFFGSFTGSIVKTIAGS
jgi:hypothetical protein